MTRLLIRLYPAAWRKRYGDELDELMGDAPGWRTAFDVFKGAMTMRLRSLSTVGMVVGFAAVGGLAGGAISYLFTPMWQARMTGRITPGISGHPMNQPVADFLMQTMSRVRSRHSLMRVLSDPRVDLYRRERLTTPLEDIEDTMRSNIRMRISSDPAFNSRNGGVVFTIGFAYPDARKAVDTTNLLISSLEREAAATPGDYTFDVLDAPALPGEPFFPKRSGFMFTGCLAGMVIALATLLVRRRTQQPGSGLQSA